MKRLLLLLLALCMAAPMALGQEDVYQAILDKGQGALVEVPSFQEDTTYTFHVPARRVAAPEYFEANGLSPDSFLGLAGETTKEQVPGSELGYKFLTSNRLIYPISMSPDGQVLLLGEDEKMLLKKGEDVYILPLNLSRSDEEEQPTYHARQDADTRIGTEGVQWSPDGRYIAFPFALNNDGSPGNWPLMLADTKENELFAIKSYHGPLSPKLNAYAQGVFSPDSAWFYYTENIGDILRLCRYNLESNTHELLLDTGINYRGKPGMGWVGDSLLCGLSKDGLGYLAAFSQQEGVWTMETDPLPEGMMPRLVQANGLTTLLALNDLAADGAPLYMLNGRGLQPAANEKGQVSFAYSSLFTSMEDLEAFRNPTNETQSAPFIHSLALKPDGRYAFAVVMTGETPSLHLLDTATLQSASLSVSPEDGDGVPALKGDRWSYGLTWYAQDDLFTTPFMGIVKKFQLQAE